jgi:predicted nuclease of predicted toxin-antitoxin system
MKFIVDAQLPRRLAYRLQDDGHDVIHTLDLPLANRTPDAVIKELSVREERIVVSKDGEFVDSLLLHGEPYKLLLISTGNIKNAELESLFLQNLKDIVAGFAQYDFIEIDRSRLTFHL